MKVVIVNGSPRKGNTVTAIEAFVEGLASENTYEMIDTDKVNISPCKGCGACQCYKGCVSNDDSTIVVDKLVAADVIIFASPVYWWGITAQLKTLIDKCYCKGANLKNKKIGTILVGGAAASDGQYDLIKTQFDCMAKYLSWEVLFNVAYSATEREALSKNEAALDELKSLANSIK